MRVLVINCGSTTLKYKLLGEADDELKLLAGASQDIAVGYRNAVETVLGALPVTPDVIAHRVVHGGGRLPEVVRIDSGVLRVLREVTPLAPMHNGPALEGIEATLSTGLPLVAALDTAFHASLPPSAWRYALPDLDGVRKVWISRLVSSVRHRTLCRSHRDTRAHHRHTSPGRGLLGRGDSPRALGGHLDGILAT